VQGRTYPVPDNHFERTVRSECVSGEGAKVRIAAPRAFRSRQVGQGWNLKELALRREIEEGKRERPTTRTPGRLSPHALVSLRRARGCGIEDPLDFMGGHWSRKAKGIGAHTNLCRGSR